MTAVDSGRSDVSGVADSSTRLGVVIVNYNTCGLLLTCLDRLHDELALLPSPSADGSPPASVVVVDNGSTDGSAQAVRRDHPWVHVEATGENLGFTAANNLQLRRWLSESGSRRPDFVLLLNPDAHLLPGALTALLRAAQSDPTIGAVVPSLSYPDGNFQHSAFRFPGLIQTALDLWPMARLMDRPINGRYPRRLYGKGVPFRIDCGLGACMLVRMTAVQAVGVLDEGFFMYCEELDWCKRMSDAGWAIMCVPSAKAIHVAGGSSSQAPGSSFAHLWRSRRRWMKKHAPGWRAHAFTWLVRAGMCSRELRDKWAAANGRLDSETRSQWRQYYREAAEAGHEHIRAGE